MTDPAAELPSRWPAEVAELVRRGQALPREVSPGGLETVDADRLGFGSGPGYRGLLFTLQPRRHEDAVAVGVFLERQRTLAQARPMARALSLELVLPRPVTDDRVLRRVPVAADRVVHVVRVGDPAEVDDQLRGWLTEAFLAAGP